MKDQIPEVEANLSRDHKEEQRKKAGVPSRQAGVANEDSDDYGIVSGGL